MTEHHDSANAAVQTIPAAALTGVHLAGLTLPEWAAITGMVCVVLQTLRALWLWRIEIKQKRSSP